MMILLWHDSKKKRIKVQTICDINTPVFLRRGTFPFLQDVALATDAPQSSFDKNTMHLVMSTNNNYDNFYNYLGVCSGHISPIE